SALHDLVPGLADIPDDQKLAHILQHLQSLPEDDTDDQANLSLAPALLEAVRSKRDLCVQRGALTPAVADALLARLAPGGQVIGLSRGDYDGTLALSIFTALTDNKPVALGQRSASQSRLVRAVPGETAPQGPPLHEKMAALADGKLVEL
ncbi:MAG TPA: hypothetical protein VL992_11735, partial [Tepidisphaeraceae bacterium]|nr:hypothetical protein [Tepidisphaeraceae bacterium]